MDLNNYIDSIDREIEEYCENMKKELEQSLWNTRKFLKENKLTPYEKQQAKEVIYIAADVFKKQIEDIEDGLLSNGLALLNYIRHDLEKQVEDIFK